MGACFFFKGEDGIRDSPAQRGHPRQARLPGRALPGLAALLIIAHPRKPSVGSKGRWGLARSRWDCTVTRQSRSEADIDCGTLTVRIYEYTPLGCSSSAGRDVQLASYDRSGCPTASFHL